MNTNDNGNETGMDVGTQGVASVYAEAMLNAAENRQQAQEVLDELESLERDVCARHPLLETFLSGSTISRDQKDAILHSTFEGRCSELVVDFLRVLNEHDRLDLLRQIVDEYREQLNQRAGRMRVRVESAVPLEQAQLDRVKQELRELFHKEPLVEARIAPELLGGLVVRVGDWLYDGSVRTRLNDIRHQLIEERTQA
jgi:F-type H+-transporting ATPase subunit delta